MTGEHTHEWHYNEAKARINYEPSSLSWSVVKFCTLCRKLEIVHLEEELSSK
jgi:hypothetical protein